MDRDTLRRLANTYLTPLFSGATLEDDIDNVGASAATVAYLDNCRLAFKADPADTYRLILFRSQPFYVQDEEGRLEKEIVSAFVASIQQYTDIIGRPIESDVLKSLQKQIVVKSIANADQQNALSRTIDYLEQWSERLYEGRRIVASVGILDRKTDSNAAMEEFVKNDFSAVLSNGHDTILIVDTNNKIHKLESLDLNSSNLSFAPHRHATIAHWATDDKLALSLNREGEILLFKNRSLLFARRAATWSFLTQKAIITQMRKPQDEAVRKAVYESCLDASFARTGACIGVVTSGHMGRWEEVVTREADKLASATSIKSKLIKRSIGNKKFQALDRRLRLEIVSIDGATLIDYEGDILAVGAILKIGGGSEGGGRLAAARTLSEYGLGIKVSADGGIKGFGWSDNKPQLLFQVM